MNEPDDLEPLSPAHRRLLDVEREPPPVPAAVRARMLSGLAAQLFPPGGDGGGGSGGSPAPHGGAGGGGAGPGAAPVVGHGAAGAVGAGASAWAPAAVAKLAIGLSVTSLAVGGVLGGAVQTARLRPRDPVQLVARAPAPPPAPLNEPPVVPVEPPPTAGEPVSPPPVASPPAARPAPTHPAPAVALPSPPAPPKSASPDGLGEERSLIDQARSAVARGEHDSAMTALREHERRFPAGQLTEERLALQVLVLAAKGQTKQAHDVATTFRARFPNGLFRSAVDGASPP